MAVVSHGAAIRVWAGLRAGNIEPDFAIRHVLDNTGIVALEGDPDAGWELIHWDDSPVGGLALADPDGGGSHRPAGVAISTLTGRKHSRNRRVPSLDLHNPSANRGSDADQSRGSTSGRSPGPTPWARTCAPPSRRNSTPASARSDHEPGPPPSEADTAVFLVAHDKASGQPVGCGGLRMLDAHTAEIKRLYVLPYTRGSGVASSILAALEAHAHALGITTHHRGSRLGAD